MLAGHQRAHVRVAVVPRADAQVLHHRLEFRDQGIRGRIAHAHGHRNRHAALARGPVAGAQQSVRGLVQVRIGHHHHVVLGAAQRLHALAIGRSTRVDVLSNRRGAHEADRLHARVIQQRVHRFLVAIHDVQHAIGQARLLQQPRQHQGGRRVAFGRFQDEGIAAGNGDRKHPHRHHAREVERRDAGDHAQR